MKGKPVNALIPTTETIRDTKLICQDAVKSGLLPATINTPEKAFIIALKGQELRLPITQAWSSIYVVNGKPAVSAELMRALIFRDCPGAKIEVTKHTDQECVMEFTRPGQKPYASSFSMEDAKKAGIITATWNKYPKAMLLARATSQGARTMFSDILMGCVYTPEELGAEVDEDENVIRPVSEIKGTVTNDPGPEQASPTNTGQGPDSPSISPEEYHQLDIHKFTSGPRTGKTLHEVFDRDSQRSFEYFNYCMGLETVNEDQEKYIKYAQILGARQKKDA